MGRRRRFYFLLSLFKRRKREKEEGGGGTPFVFVCKNRWGLFVLVSKNVRRSCSAVEHEKRLQHITNAWSSSDGGIGGWWITPHCGSSVSLRVPLSQKYILFCGCCCCLMGIIAYLLLLLLGRRRLLLCSQCRRGERGRRLVVCKIAYLSAFVGINFASMEKCCVVRVRLL